MRATHGTGDISGLVSPSKECSESSRWRRAALRPALRNLAALALVSACMTALSATAACAQHATVSISSIPNPVAPGGVLGYLLTVVNNGTAQRDITVTISYDPHLTFVARSGDGVTDTSGGLATALTFSNVAAGASKSVRLEMDVNSSTPVSDPSTTIPQLLTAVTETGVTGGTTCVAGAPSKIGSSCDVHSACDRTAGSGDGVCASAATPTSVRPEPEGGTAPFVVTMTDTPDPLSVTAGSTLAYRLTVINFGALERVVGVELDYDPNLTFDSDSWADDTCGGKQCVGTPGFEDINAYFFGSIAVGGSCSSDAECASAGLNPAKCIWSLPAGCTGRLSTNSYTLVNVTPGKARVLSLAATLNAGTTATELLSSVTVTSEVIGTRPSLATDTGGVSKDVQTTVTVCKGAAAGTPCDNGDPCPGDTCDAGEFCQPLPCPIVCSLPGAAEGDPCVGDNRCVVSECDALGDCVPKLGTGAEVCTAGNPSLLGALCTIDAECDSIPDAGDGVCERAPRQVICPACETCSPATGCQLDPEKTGNVCRFATTGCDVPEVCDGVSGSCPEDVYAPDGTFCDDGDQETAASTCEARPEPYFDSVCGIGSPSLCGNGAVDTVCTAGDPFVIGGPCAVDSDCDKAAVAGHCNQQTHSCDIGADQDCTTNSDCDVPAVAGNCGPEQCDDGNTAGGDCCLPSCTYDAAGESCEDGLACNGAETCDGGGGCTPGTAPDCNASSGVCALSGVCQEPEGCNYASTPAEGCLGGWGRSTIVLSEVYEGREKFLIRMGKGPAAVQGDFGDPTSVTDYTICLYRIDTGDFAGEIILDRAGETCGDDGCWRPASNMGFIYRDDERLADGVRKARLVGGIDGKSRITISGGNDARESLMSQPLGITKNLEHSFDGIRVQIRSADAPACFEEYFTGIKRTGPTYFGATN